MEGTPAATTTRLPGSAATAAPSVSRGVGNGGEGGVLSSSYNTLGRLKTRANIVIAIGYRF